MKFKFPKHTLDQRKFTVTPVSPRAWSLAIKNDRIILQTITFWLGGILVSFLIVVLFFNSIPNEIPLFYSRPMGAGQLANKIYLLLLPGGTFALGLINLCFILISYKKEKIISYTFCLITILITILSLLSLFNIIHLIT